MLHRPHPSVAKAPRPVSPMPPLKLNMLLHFYAIVGRYPDEAVRTSQVYVTFVREMLRDGLIERPQYADRASHSGWAYRTTDKGRVYVEAIMRAATNVPLPIATTPQWIVPADAVLCRGPDINLNARDRIGA